MTKPSARQVAVVLSLNLERLIGMKKTLLRTLSALFALCCLCALVTPVSAASFSDVDGLSTQYRDAINYVSDNGIIGGTAEGYFEPNTAITRAMAVTILYRMSGDTGTYTEASQFSDVSASAYYYNAVGWGVSTGIVTGYTEGYFAPHNSVLLQELCVFLYRFAQAYGGGTVVDEDISSATDYSNISAYALTAVRWAYSYGLKTQTTSSSAINPKGTVPRKDAALYVHRYRLNVEGIKFGRDNFSFLNTAGSFTSGSCNYYSISGDDKATLDDYAESQGNMIKQLYDSDYDTFRQLGWDGCCYGICLAVALDYTGKIDFNGNYCTNTATVQTVDMYDVPVPGEKNNAHHLPITRDFQAYRELTVVDSKLNMYYISQLIFQNTANAWSVQSTNVDAGLRELYSQLEHGGIALLRFVGSHRNYNDVNHAVIAYGKPTASGSDYKIRIYDPNSSTATYLLIDQLAFGGRVKSISRQEVVAPAMFSSRLRSVNLKILSSPLMIWTLIPTIIHSRSVWRRKKTSTRGRVSLLYKLTAATPSPMQRGKVFALWTVRFPAQWRS